MDKILNSKGKQIKVNIALAPGDVLREKLPVYNTTNICYENRSLSFSFQRCAEGKKKIECLTGFEAGKGTRNKR